MTIVNRDRKIEHWDAEDVEAWEAGGDKIAKRNLIWSIFAEHVGFSVWSIWSVMVLFMPQNVYHIDPAGKFYLVAVPTLVGAAMRIPYTIAPARFGGRNWTVVSALLLLIPTALTWYVMKQPGTTYTTFMVVAAFAGFGGGNFASSMTNINAFYPQRLKGWALGLNAGGGNIGVPVIQLVGLLVIAAVSSARPEIVCAIYLVLIALAALGAALFMDNLGNQRSNLGAMAEALRYKHSWVMSFLYIGTFGSFIGFSAVFPKLIKDTFPEFSTFAVAGAALSLSFLGPLVGSLSRPVGGRLADRIGGARITVTAFAAMATITVAVIATLPLGNFWLFLFLFMLLFAASGIGNGSTYKMIPTVFSLRSVENADAVGPERKASAALGLVSAIGAYGGFLIPQVLGLSATATGGYAPAFAGFVAAYLALLGLAWFCYLRPGTVFARQGV
jgi:MFS transporter, NNP family, nitrate/nitrite transporter